MPAPKSGARSTFPEPTPKPKDLGATDPPDEQPDTGRIDYDKLADVLVEQFESDSGLLAKLRGPRGERAPPGEPGRSPKIDYDVLADRVMKRLRDEGYLSGLKGKRGPAGVVTIVIKEDGEVKHMVENVPAGATVDVPIERTIIESERDK